MRVPALAPVLLLLASSAILSVPGNARAQGIADREIVEALLDIRQRVEVPVEFVANARPVMAAADVADHLMGVRDVLTAEEIDYLDEIGNGNGAFDVGDFRAWLQFTGMLGSIRQGSGEEVAP